MSQDLEALYLVTPKPVHTRKRKRADESIPDQFTTEPSRTESNGPDQVSREELEKQNMPSTINLSVIHGPASTAQEHSNPQPEFPYRRLNAGFFEIRIVILQAGPDSSPINCQIEHVRADRLSNDSDEAYNALSYTWGLPDVTKTICLDDITVQVRENLWQVSHVCPQNHPVISAYLPSFCTGPLSSSVTNTPTSIMDRCALY